jgi:hypothetical protein
MYVVRAEVSKELGFESKGFGIESEIVAILFPRGTEYRRFL